MPPKKKGKTTAKKKGKSKEAKNDDEEKEEAVPWGKSEARDVLYQLLLDGKIPKASEMKPKAIFEKHLRHLPEFEPFQDYTALNFANKLQSTRERASKKADRAAEDLEFFEHDRAIFPAPELDTKGLPFWKDSTARKLLRKALDDIASGKKEYQKPRILYKEHPEWYDTYPLEIF